MRRVLIVGDSATPGTGLVERLGASDWVVETEANGEHGAILALASPPDAVVCDLWMPGLSGLHLCQLLRGDPVTAGVPVVLVSGSSDRRARFWGQRAGAHAFLEKGDLAALERVLVSLPAACHDPRVTADLEPAIRPSSIPGRLSSLLDRALFDAVVAGELRALAFTGSDVEALFAGLTRLLTELVEYAWLALSVRRGDTSRVFVHQHTAVGTTVPPAVFHALGHHAGIAEPRVSLDDLPSQEAPYGPPVVLAVSLAGQDLGTLVVAPARRAPSRDEEKILSLAALELALPLHAVALLAESRRLAATDPLTGLANRRRGADELAREVARCDRYKHTLAIALVDVDHFKRVNDSYGHAVGDKALCHVAAVLRSGLRECDTIARWGGEEFLVVLPSTSLVGARVAVERLRAAAARTQMELDDGGALRLTVSVGLAQCTGQGIDRLLDDADRALYRAKTRGRNRVEVEGPPP